MTDKILVVDDSGTARMFVIRCLQISRVFDSVEFLEAGNGVEALKVLQDHQVRMVFTDLTMPEMDGESLFKRIKANPKLNEIPVVVISSIGNPAKDRQLLERGAQAVIKKPVSPAKLAEVFRGMGLMPN
jgi:two-component system, chemotaxis family, chemotaxis protein CheY